MEYSGCSWLVQSDDEVRPTESALLAESAAKSTPRCLRMQWTPRSFQVSVWDPWTGTYFLLCAVDGVLLLIGLIPRGALAPGLAFLVVVTVGLFVTGRRRLVVGTDGTWGDVLAFGVRLRRKSLGLHPVVEDGGWDWAEVSACPADSAWSIESDRLHFVLVQWTSGGGEQAQVAGRMIQQIRSEIERIQGPWPVRNRSLGPGAAANR